MLWIEAIRRDPDARTSFEQYLADEEQEAVIALRACVREGDLTGAIRAEATIDGLEQLASAFTLTEREEAAVATHRAHANGRA